MNQSIASLHSDVDFGDQSLPQGKSLQAATKGNTEVTSRTSVHQESKPACDNQSNQGSISQAPTGGRINIKVTQGSMASLSQADNTINGD